MEGLTMGYPLSLTRLLERAATDLPSRWILTKIAEGYFVYTNKDVAKWVHRLARAIQAMGIGLASFAWNSQRRLDPYCVVPCLGAVLQNANILRFPQQIAYKLPTV